MRRWGMVITAFYATALLLLVLPVWVRLSGQSWAEAYTVESGSEFSVLVPLALPVIGQFLLLFTTVDTSWRRLKPRQHIAVSAVTVALFAALLAFGIILSLWTVLATTTDHIRGWERWGFRSFLMLFTGLWVSWGVAFYAYYRAAPDRIVRAVSWLLRGSVLELLIAVPAHVIVRRKDECSAPIATGFGIAAGIAVMLACFGPGVLVLYKKRLDGYRKQRPNVAVQG